MKPTKTLASLELASASAAPSVATIVLQEHDGEFYLRINNTTLMSTKAHSSELEMAALACVNLGSEKAAKPRVLIGGLGFGYTLRGVLELVPPDASVEVAELLPEIVEWNRRHLQSINGRLLDDPRVTIRSGDVFDCIRKSAGESYHAVLLDVDNSPDPLVQNANQRLYRPEGLLAIRRCLRKDGRAVFWSGNLDQSFEDELSQIFPRVESVPAKAYPRAKRPTHMLFVADCI
ncbi:MAG: spermine synthase [bacterium]|nr:spermine synthase [bacterium]